MQFLRTTARLLAVSILSLLFACLFPCSHSALAGAAIVEVVIGGPVPDEGAPEPGVLNRPFGVDFDAAGNMYIVESVGGRVHRLGTDGKLATIAGDGSRGYTGDGAPARHATFNGMHSVAALPDGTLYIADTWNHCVRRIDGNTGIITTIAGTGQPSFSGDGGPAVKATFNYLMCASLTSANDALYVADTRNLRIRRIDLESGIVTSIAGNGEKGVPKDGVAAARSPLVDPRAVASARDGQIYILERNGHALRVVTPDGRIRTVAGTGVPGMGSGPALESGLNAPKHLAVSPDGKIYIADDGNDRICVFDPVAGTIEGILGAGVDNPNIILNRPHGVRMHTDGSLYVADTWNHRVLRLRWQPDPM